MRRLRRRKQRKITPQKTFDLLFPLILWLENRDKLYVITAMMNTSIVINDLIEVGLDFGIPPAEQEEPTYYVANYTGFVNWKTYEQFDDLLEDIQKRGQLDLPDHLLPSNFTDVEAYLNTLKDHGYHVG